MTNEELHKKIISCGWLVGMEDYKNFGNEMFNMYTEGGFPPEMFFDEIKKKYPDSTNDQLAIMVCWFQFKFTEHRLKSMEFMGKNHKKIIERNLKVLKEVFETGEFNL